MVGGELLNTSVTPGTSSNAGEMQACVSDQYDFLKNPEQSIPPSQQSPAESPPPATYVEVTPASGKPECSIENGVTQLLTPDMTPAQSKPTNGFIEFTPEVMKFANATGVPPEKIMRMLMGPAPKTPAEGDAKEAELADLVSGFDSARYEEFSQKNPAWFKKHATQLDESFKDRAFRSGPGMAFTVVSLLAADAIASVASSQGWLPLDRAHHAEERSAFVLAGLEAGGKGMTTAKLSYEIWKNMRAGLGAGFANETKVAGKDGAKVVVKGYQLEKSFGRALYKSLTREFAGNSAKMAGFLLAAKAVEAPFKLGSHLGAGILAQKAVDGIIDSANEWLKGHYKDSTTPPTQILAEGTFGREVIDAAAFVIPEAGEVILKKRIKQWVARAPVLALLGPVGAGAVAMAGAGAIFDMGMMFSQRLTYGRDEVGFQRYVDQEITKGVEEGETMGKLREEARTDHRENFADFMTWAYTVKAARMTIKFFAPLTYSFAMSRYGNKTAPADYGLKVYAKINEQSELLRGEAGLAPSIRNTLIDGVGQDPDSPEFYFDRATVNGSAFEADKIKFTSEEQEFYDRYSWLMQNGNISPAVKQQELQKLIRYFPPESGKKLEELDKQNAAQRDPARTREIVKLNEEMAPARRAIQDKVALYELQENLGVLHFLHAEGNEQIHDITSDDGIAKKGKGDELLRYAYPGKKSSADMHEVKDAILIERIQMLATRLEGLGEGTEEYARLDAVRNKVFTGLVERISKSPVGSPERRAAEEFLENARDRFTVERLRGDCRKMFNYKDKGSEGYRFYLNERKSALKEFDDRVAAAQKSGDAGALKRAVDARGRIYAMLDGERKSALAKNEQALAQAPQGSERRAELESDRQFIGETLAVHKPEDPPIPKPAEPVKPKEKTPDEKIAIGTEVLLAELGVRERCLSFGITDESAISRSIEKEVTRPLCKKYGIKEADYFDWRQKAMGLAQLMADESNRGKTFEQRVQDALNSADGRK